MGRHHQQRDERGGRVGGEGSTDLFGEFSKPTGDGDAFRFLCLRLVQEYTETVHRIPEPGSQPIEILELVGGELPMPAEMLEDGADQRDGGVGILQDQLGEQAASLAGEFFPQPIVADLAEGELRLVAVHHGGPGVDVGLDRIGCDEPLAEAVDGRAGHLVERRIGPGEVAALLFRQAFGQGGAKLDRNIAGRKRAHEGAHPNEQLTRGELGERHGGNGLGGDASR